jgi:predicted nucleic acid-binding protein
MAKRPIFDTSVFPDYAAEIEKLLLSCLFLTVVFYELVATSIDDSTLQKYERWRVLANKNKLLLNPTANDWWETSKAIRRLYLMENEQPTKIKTLRNDALIARLAVIHDGFVVTHDTDDFQIIQKVMPNLKILSAKEFFES